MGDSVAHSLMFHATDDVGETGDDSGNAAALSHLAELALTSMDKVTREQAAQQLLFLGSYDHWHTTKQLFMRCSNQYLYFMVSKAVLFIVRNELGPQERSEMAICALERLQRHRKSGELLPRFLKGLLYSVFVSGMYSNWKIALFTMLQGDSVNTNEDEADEGGENSSNHHHPNTHTDAEGEEDDPTSSTAATTTQADRNNNNNSNNDNDDAVCGKDSHDSRSANYCTSELNPNNIGPTLVRQFEHYLAPDEALDCLLEAITYFAAQSAKLQIMDLEASYAKYALPYFFLIAANSLSSFGARAAEVCCAALDCVPRTDVLLVQVGVTTDVSIQIANWPVWNGPFLTVMRFCRAAILEEPGGADAALYARLLRSCSCVICPEASFLRVRNDFARELLLIADSLLAMCEQDNTQTELLLVACIISVNTLERYEDVAVEHFTAHSASATSSGGSNTGENNKNKFNNNNNNRSDNNEYASYSNTNDNYGIANFNSMHASSSGYDALMRSGFGLPAGASSADGSDTNANANIAALTNHGAPYNSCTGQIVHRWAQAALFVITRFDDNEDELRRWLMQLFYLFGDRLLPDKSHSSSHRSLCSSSMMMSMPLSDYPASAMVGTTAASSSSSTAEVGGLVNSSSTYSSGGGAAAAALLRPPKTLAAGESEMGTMNRARGYSFPPAMTGSSRLGVTATCTYPRSSCSSSTHANNTSYNNNNNINNDATSTSAAATEVSACDETNMIEWAVRTVCIRYFETVVSKAPLREGSSELRSANGVILHNERTLMPLSQLLFCERVTLKPALIDTLQRTIEQYRMCLREREQLRQCGSEGGGAVGRGRVGGKESSFVGRLMRYTGLRNTTVNRSDTDINNVTLTNSSAELPSSSMHSGAGGRTPDHSSRAHPGDGVMFALAAEYTHIIAQLDDESALLFLTNACLSRLSVMISVFAIAMVNEIVVRDDTVLELIAGFARELLTEDDSLTDELLRCLTLTDTNSFMPDFSSNNNHGSGSNSAAGCGASNSGGMNSANAKVHVAVLRSLFFFCGCVYESEFLRRTAFYEIVLNLLKFVYLHHSDEPALLMDANMLLYRTVTNGASATVFLNSPKLYSIITAVSADRITALHFPWTDTRHPIAHANSTNMASSSSDRYFTNTGSTNAIRTMRRDINRRIINNNNNNKTSSIKANDGSENVALNLFCDENDARSDFLTSFCVFVETRFYAGYEVDNVLSVLVRRTLSTARLQSRYAKRALEDVVAITRACCQPDSLETVLAATFESAESVLNCMRVDSACVPVALRWAAQLCGLAHEALDRNTTAQTPWRLGRFIFAMMQACFRDLTVRSGNGDEMMSAPAITTAPATPFAAGFAAAEVTAAASSTSASGLPRTSYRFAGDVAEPAMIYDLADVVQGLCHGSWFNIGVALYYERETVEDFFCGAVQLLLSTSVQMVMSNERGCHKMFAALLSVLVMQTEVTRQICMLFIRRGLWQRLLSFLSKCLGYAFHPILLQVMLIIIQINEDYAQDLLVQQQQASSSSPGEDWAKSIDEATLGAVFYETAVLLVVAPHLELGDMHYCFELLQRCYKSAPMPCTNYMDRLLTYCSAYHRVRLRMVLTMLRERRKNIMQHYLQVFGQTSKVGVLAAW